MGKLMSRLNRQYYRFNAENRAHREIAKEKPTPAPRHPSTENAMKMILQETQDIKQKSMMKDEALDEYLRKVYVVSHDPVQEKRKKPSEKSKLPLNRKHPKETSLGYIEPDVIPKGKVTLMQVSKFLSDHLGDPEGFNVHKIAKDYDLPEEDVGYILQYFGSFKLYINEDVAKSLTLQERVRQYFNYPENIKPLPSGKES